MSYGFQTWNADGRKMIDSTELAPNTYLVNMTTSAYSAMSYPPRGFSAGDLVIARPANNPSLFGNRVPIGIGRPIRNVQQFYGSQTIRDAGFTYEWANTSGIKTGLIKSQYGIAAPTAGEHGLDVYAKDGRTIMFSATRSTAVSILAHGSLVGGERYTYTPSPALDYNKIYAVVNSTTIMAIPRAYLFPSRAVGVAYNFYPTASSPYIEMRNQVLVDDNQIAGIGGRFAYALVYDPN